MQHGDCTDRIAEKGSEKSVKEFLRRIEVDMVSSTGLQDKSIVIEKPK